jgi:hypothetical protein
LKTEEFVALGRAIVSELPGFFVHKYMILATPVRHALRGVLFESSGFQPKGFYAWAFVQPLCVPAEHEVLDCGWRLGGEAHVWDSSGETVQDRLLPIIRSDVLPFLKRSESPGSLAEAVQSLGFSDSPACQRAVAYSLARAGEYRRAGPLLEALAAPGINGPDWQRERANEAQHLLSLVQADKDSAQRQLEEWEKQTASNLGLSAYR